MTTNTEPIAGKLYKCTLSHGSSRTCRYGYHRKNNDRIWSDPPAGERPTCIWYGWRDDDNYRFIREEEVISFVQISVDGAELSVPEHTGIPSAVALP